MEPSDGDLVRAARDGRPEAFGDLVRRYWRRVRSICVSRLGPTGPADDLAQEAFLKALRQLSALDDPARFGPWVLGIAVRVALDWRKARARGEVGLEAAALAALPDRTGAERDERVDRRRRVVGAVMELPEIYRDTVFLFYFEKQTYDEMARLLDVTPAAIQARLGKARAMLRRRLEEAPER